MNIDLPEGQIPDEIRIPIGDSAAYVLRVGYIRYQSRLGLDCRIYYQDRIEGRFKPTPKGFRLKGAAEIIRLADAFRELAVIVNSTSPKVAA